MELKSLNDFPILWGKSKHGLCGLLSWGPGYPSTSIFCFFPLSSEVLLSSSRLLIVPQSLLSQNLMFPLPVIPMPTPEHLLVPTTVPPIYAHTFFQTQLRYYFLKVAFPLKLRDLCESPIIWLISMVCIQFHNPDSHLFNACVSCYFPKMPSSGTMSFLALYPQILAQYL